MEAAGEAARTIGGGGVTVVGPDSPSVYHIALKSENSNPPPAPASPTPPSPPPPQQADKVAAPPPAKGTAAYLPSGPPKKKRGRPRKYGPDGSVVALSPKPISSAPPPPPQVIDFSSPKRGKVKPASSFNRSKYEVESLGEWASCSFGPNFTPHIITVNSGEDVTMKITSFSQQGPRALCVLSASGVISCVTLRQPDSSGGTLTYDGCFEILTLSGSFIPNDAGGTRSRSGGMSVSLASPDGRIVGGGVAGLLVAAGPVQVVVGSFLACNQHDYNPKNQKHDFVSTPRPTAAIPISTAIDLRTTTFSPSLLSDARNIRSDINVSLT